MSIVPKTATTSLMRYEVYRRKNVSPEELKAEIDFYNQVEGEDKFLANGAQANLNSDTYTAGPLHPELEEGVTYVEAIIRKMLHEHLDREKSEGKQIWPARRSMPGQQLEDDEAFYQDVCKLASCGGSEQLAW